MISRILSKGSPNVDSVSGATYSSTGIINAVKRALSQAALDDSKKEIYKIEALKPVNVRKMVLEPIEDDGPSEYEDGVYYGTADGFGGEIRVEVTVKKGKIAKISVESAPAQIVSSQNADVDIVSGATYSSDTIRSIAARIISEIPMVEGVGDGNKEEETQPENDAVGPAAVPSDLPVRDEPPAQGGEEPANGEEAPDAEEPANGEEAPDGEEPANGEEAPDDGRTADEEALSDREERQESVEAAGEENTDIPAEESSDPAGKEDAPDSREAQAPDAAKPDEDTANTGGDRS